MPVKFDGATTRDAFAGSDLLSNTLEKCRGGVRIGIDKNKPIAGRTRSAGVSSAGDLVDGFEDNLSPGRSGDFGGFIGRIVIANDEFSFPLALMESGQRTINVPQSFAKAAFFVKGRDDNRDFQALPNQYV